MNSSKTFIAILVSFQCLFLFSLAGIPISLNSSGQFQLPSSDIVEFIIDNSSSQEVVQFDLSVDIDNSHNLSSAHFLLLICGTRTPPSDFISNIALVQDFLYYQKYYDIFMIDIDGLSSGSKKLSVFYSKTSSNDMFNQLFVYALGPYKFGENTPTYTGYRTESYLSSYSVTTQRTCQGNCNGHGDCIGYAQNLNYCKCQSGFISSDCSVPAQILVLDTKSTDYSGIVNLKPGDKLYLKIDFSDIRNQIVKEQFLNLNTSSPIVMFKHYAKKEEQQYLTPDYMYWINKLRYESGNAVDSLNYSFKISSDQIQDYIQGQGSLVALFTEVTTSTTIKFGLSLQSSQVFPDDNESNDSDSNTNIEVILSIVLPLAGVGICFISFVISVRRHLARRQLVAQQLADEQFQKDRERQNSQESLRRNSININELPPVQAYEYLLDKLMPAQPYNPNSNLLNNYVSLEKEKDKLNIDCEICTELLSSISSGEVRKTICNHVFHSHCLMQRLKQNQSCPTCNRSLTTASLVSFQANPHSYQDMVYIAVFPYRE